MRLDPRVEIAASKRERILISYWYYRNQHLGEYFGLDPRDPDGPLLFVDSGGFSAYSQRKEVDIGRYAEWLHQWEGWYVACANLDDKASWRKTLRNQQELESRGIRPIPIYHGGEPLSLLRDYVQEYKYVAFGGLTNKTTERYALESLFEQALRVCAEYGAVVHGFGTSTSGFFWRYPFYSADSSSWTSSHRYGRLPLYDPKSRKIVMFTHGKYNNGKTARDFAALFRLHGFDWRGIDALVQRAKTPERVISRERRTFCEVSRRAYRLLEADVRLARGTVPSRTGDDDGLHLYLAHAGGGMGGSGGTGAEWAILTRDLEQVEGLLPPDQGGWPEGKWRAA